MKNKIKKISLLGASFLAINGGILAGLTCCSKSKDTTDETVGQVVYEATTTGVKVTGLSNPSEKIKTITIPDQYNGKTVESIDEGALKGCSKLEKVTLPFIGKSKDATGKEALFGWVFGETMYDGCGGFTWQEYDEDTTNELETIYASYCIPISLETVEITNPTKVAPGAFSNCKYLDSIKIAKADIETIGNKAFLGCSGIMNFDLSFANGLKTIEHAAFAKCLTLQYAELPSTVKSIGASAFEGCICCTRINVPAATTTIGSRAFNSIPGLILVEVSESQTHISTWAEDWVNPTTPIVYDFTSESSVGYTSEWTAIICGAGQSKYCYLAQWMGNWQQTSVVIPGEVTINGTTYPVKHIGAKCFQENTYVQNITIEEGLTDIHPRTFEYCTNLQYVTFPSTLKSIRANAFNGCTKLIGHIDNNVKVNVIKLLNTEVIGDAAFKNCSSIIDVKMPKATEIGNEAFAYCTHLCPDTTDNEDNCLLIPASCKSIGESAFKFCFKYAPDSVTTSPYYPTVKFEDSNKITKIPKSCFESCGVRVQKPTSGEDKGAQYPKQIRIHIDLNGAKLTEIDDAAFKNCWLANLRGARNTHIKRIGDYAFYYAQPTSDISVAGGKQSLQMDQEIEYIGEYAFAYCTTVQELKFNTAIDYEDGSQKEMKCNSLKHLGQYAFYGCSNSEFTTLDLSPCIYLENTISDETKEYDTIDKIGKFPQYTARYSFAQCTNLQKIYLPGYQDAQHPYIAQCTSFTRIPERMFEGCTSIGKDGSSVTFPSNINDIRPYSFNGCNYLTKVYIDGSIRFLGSGVFQNNYILESITKTNGNPIEFNPDYLTNSYVGSYVFYNCYKLQNPPIPFITRTDTEEHLNTNFTIHDYTYYQNKSLGYGSVPFTVPFNCASIGTYSFTNCISLEKVVFQRKPKWDKTKQEPIWTDTNVNVCNIIYSYAFSGCTSLSSINLEDTNLGSLYGNVFTGCESLTEIKLPSRSITFYNKPFDGWVPKSGGAEVTATVHFHKNNTNKYNDKNWKQALGWPESFKWRNNSTVNFTKSQDGTYYTCDNNAFGGNSIRFVPYDLPA